MEQIELKISPKPLVVFFVLFFTFTSAFLGYFAQNQPLLLLLTITFFASVVVVGAAFAFLYFNQKKVILTDTEIKKIGYTSTSIPYSDIEKIKVGSGGYSIYYKDNSPINITTMYSNFSEAKKLLNEKIKDHDDIEITGTNAFVNKYIIQK